MIGLDELDFIPLLSKKPLCRFTPEEYRAYVRSLYARPKKKVSSSGKKKLRELKVTVKKLKRGGLSIKTKRDPKYVTREEYKTLAQAHPESEVFLALRKAQIHIYETHEEAERIKLEVSEIPF